MGFLRRKKAAASAQAQSHANQAERLAKRTARNTPFEPVKEKPAEPQAPAGEELQS